MNPGFVSVGDLKSLRTAIDRRRAAKVADAQEHVSHPSKKCGETLINVIVINWLPNDFSGSEPSDPCFSVRLGK